MVCSVDAIIIPRNEAAVCKLRGKPRRLAWLGDGIVAATTTTAAAPEEPQPPGGTSSSTTKPLPLTTLTVQALPDPALPPGGPGATVHVPPLPPPLPAALQTAPAAPPLALLPPEVAGALSTICFGAAWAAAAARAPAGSPHAARRAKHEAQFTQGCASLRRHAAECAPEPLSDATVQHLEALAWALAWVSVAEVRCGGGGRARVC